MAPTFRTVPFRSHALVVALAIGSALGGCASPGQQTQLLLEENGELRQRLHDTEARLAESEQIRAQLEADNLAMSRQLDSLASAGPGWTGFEGIEGVQVSQSGGEIIVGIAGDVLFDSGSATLKPEAKRSLDRIASVLNSEYASNVIRVEGYTDSDPIRKSNWKSNEHLSAERALAVEAYLVGKGVNNERIYAAAFGPARPKATKAQSRRVEIVILASGS